MKSKKIISVILCVAMVLSLATVTAFAAYGRETSVEIPSGTSYVYSGMVGKKTTSSKSWHLYVESKTMWSEPTAKLVNSDGATRGTTITISGEDAEFAGASNTGTIGYDYYLAVKPHKSQLGTDYITGQVNPD